jgi:hypothetical protein
LCFGASSYEKLIANSILSNSFGIITFLNTPIKGINWRSIPILPYSQLDSFISSKFILVIGDNSTSKLIAEKLLNITLGVFNHPTTIIIDASAIRECDVIMALSLINTNTSADKHVILIPKLR